MSHPHRIAAREIFVHRHDVNTFAGQSIQVCRRDAGQGLAFTGHHLGDRTAVKHQTAEDLHIERSLPQSALRRFARERERFNEKFIERLARSRTNAQGIALRSQLLIAERRDRCLKRVDLGEGGSKPLQGVGAEDLFKKSQHPLNSFFGRALHCLLRVLTRFILIDLKTKFRF